MTDLATAPGLFSIFQNRTEHEKRITQKLKRELGPMVCGLLLEDPCVIEIMLNPDGTLWVERLGKPMEMKGTV